jgi:hypothetical protein
MTAKPRQTSPKPPVNARRRWTAADRKRLLWLASEVSREPGMIRTLARKFGRTPGAIRHMLRKCGWAGPGGRTLHECARLLNMTDSNLLELVRYGRFIPDLPYHDRPNSYAILDDDLWAWMTDKRSWHYWRPERLQEPVWRAYFAALRRDWLSTAEAAALLCLCPAHVTRLRTAGYLPGEKPTPRACWFHRADVLAFKERYLSGGVYQVAPAGRRPRAAEPADAARGVPVDWPAPAPTYAYEEVPA